MNGEAVTYVELDLNVCGLTYGVHPCMAVLEGDFKPTWASYLYNTANGWVSSNATLTKTAEGLEVLATGTDPIINRSGISVPGGANTIIEVEATRLVAGSTWDGKVFYTTSGHTYDAGYYKQFAGADPFPVGERVKLFIDMSSLTAGGTDWTTNTITGIRLDFDQTGTGEILLHSVRIGHYASADEATGTEKCFNTRKTCQDPTHYDIEDRPDGSREYVTTLSNNSPGTTVTWNDVAVDPNGSIALTVSARRLAGGVAISSATIEGEPAEIVVQQGSGGTRSAILFAEGPFGSTVDISITFPSANDWVRVGVWRLENMTPVASDSSTGLPVASDTVSVNESGTILSAVTSYLMSSTTWVGLDEVQDGSQSNGDFSFAGQGFTEDDAAHLVSATQTYLPRTAPTLSATFPGPRVDSGPQFDFTGLASGDLLLVAIVRATGTTGTTPTNWTLLSTVDGSGVKIDLYRRTALWTSGSTLTELFVSPQRDYGVGMVVKGVPDVSLIRQIGQSHGTSTTSPSAPSINTDIANTLVIDIIGRLTDIAGAQFSAQANANLSGYVENFDNGTTQASGSGIMVASGLKVSAGGTGTSSATLANASAYAAFKLGLAPTDNSDTSMAMVTAVFDWALPFRHTKATVRFGMDVGHQSKEIDSINCLIDYSHTPTVVSLGESLGTRESLSLSFADVPHPDVGPGFDPYWDERDYDPYEQGTLFGKLVSRQPYMRGITVRWYEGFSDESLDEMVVRTLILDSVNGPDSGFKVTITAKDPLKLADSDKSLAPLPSDGYLLNDITNSATSATLSPSGIGESYPTSGLATIGGNELVTFTRSGDTLTLVRGTNGTPATAHSQQDRFQLALSYSSQDVADIIYDLLVSYSEGIDPAWIDLADWQAETDAYLRRVYSSIIGEPTSARKLIVELIISCGLAIWWDSAAAKIRLMVLREVSADATVIDDSVYMSAPSLRDQPDKRVSQMIVHFSIKDPLKGLTDPNNFQQSVRVISAESELNYETSSLKNVFSRWIAPFARTTAERVGDINVGRFANAPKRVSFPIFRNAQVIPVTGGAYRLKANNLQLPNGELDTLPIQVTSVRVERDRYLVEGEEMRFITNEQDLVNRVITIDGTSYNLNLRDIHDEIYPALRDGDTITFIINETARVGSMSETLPALDVGTWPVGFTPHLDIRGKVQGCGGTGGKGANEGGDEGSGGKNGTQGGTALYTREAITLTSPGNIWGGGGGGAGGSCANFDDHRGGGGGGGAGLRGGTGGIGPGNGEDGQPGTETAGGAYGRSYTSSTFWTGPSLRSNVHGGAGGAPGTAGDNDVGGYDVSGGSPGAAGNCIDGISYVTNIGATGTRLGPQVN